MALIKCPECGKEKVSDSAACCPECGFGIKEYVERKNEEQRLIEEKLAKIQMEIEMEEQRIQTQKIVEQQRQQIKQKIITIFKKYGIVTTIIVVCFSIGITLYTNKRKNEYNQKFNEADAILCYVNDCGQDLVLKLDNYIKQYSGVKLADTEDEYISFYNAVADLNDYYPQNADMIDEIFNLKKYELLDTNSFSHFIAYAEVNYGVDLSKSQQECLDKYKDMMVNRQRKYIENRNISNKITQQLSQEKREKQKTQEKENKKKPKIGMTKQQVLATEWGTPQKKNVTEYSFGVSEQWVYSGYRYVYFDDGIVTAVDYNE